MATYKFVHYPKGTEKDTVIAALKEKMTCEIKEACLGGLFVRYTTGTLDAFKIGEAEIDVAEARRANEENWAEMSVEY